MLDFLNNNSHVIMIVLRLMLGLLFFTNLYYWLLLFKNEDSYIGQYSCHVFMMTSSLVLFGLSFALPLLWLIRLIFTAFIVYASYKLYIIFRYYKRRDTAKVIARQLIYIISSLALIVLSFVLK